MSRRRKGQQMDIQKALAHESQIDTEPAVAAPRGPVFYDYQGRTGASQLHEHVATSACLIKGHPALVLEPGLNMIPAELFDAYKSHGPVVDKLDSGRLVSVDLTKLWGPQLSELIRRTTSPSAIEHLYRLEMAKDLVDSNPKRRRNEQVVDLLTSKLAACKRRRPITLGGMVG